MTATENKLPEHLFVSDVDGGLHDTRKPGWEKDENVVRPNYKRTHREIKTTADLKATLRAGKYAWPGGYPMYFITSDGAALNFSTVREELCNVLDSIKRGSSGGWRVVACDINYEGHDLIDAHTSESIECAYPKDEEE